MPLIKIAHHKKRYYRIRSGGSIINTLLNNLPSPELHLLDSINKKYNYCGPFTKLKQRVVLNEKGDIVHVITEPINDLDYACMNHDIAYDKHRDVSNRNQADRILYDAANKFYNESNSKLDKLNAGIVRGIMNTKINYKL